MIGWSFPIKVACPHPSFAIVVYKDEWDDLGTNLYGLRCYHCRKEMPFFFYTKEEWDELGEDDDHDNRHEDREPSL